MADSTYFLTFSIQFDRDPGLDTGRLCLRHLDKGTVAVWVATSSTEGKQYPESFHNKGGIIPPEYRCLDVKHWEVLTAPLDLSSVKGVEGSFFKIEPYEVTTDKGGVRGDFGIHLDANVPGSSGCIVMGSARFADFERKMNDLKLAGILRLPLFVTLT